MSIVSLCQVVVYIFVFIVFKNFTNNCLIYSFLIVSFLHGNASHKTSAHQSINQSTKRIYIAQYVASESESHVGLD